MSTDDFLCSQHNKHSNNNCNHEDPSQSSNIYINLSYWPEHFNFFFFKYIDSITNCEEIHWLEQIFTI
jgi:hypothetical protein